MSVYIRKKEQDVMKQFNLFLSWGNSGAQANKMIKEKYGYGLRLQVQNQQYSRFKNAQNKQINELQQLHHASTSYTTIKTNWSAGLPGYNYLYNYTFSAFSVKDQQLQTFSLNMTSTKKLRIDTMRNQVTNALQVIQEENSNNYNFDPTSIDFESITMSAIYEMGG